MDYSWLFLEMQTAVPSLCSVQAPSRRYSLASWQEKLADETSHLKVDQSLIPFPMARSPILCGVWCAVRIQSTSPVTDACRAGKERA